MSSTTRARFRASIALVAPVVLATGFVYHPYVAIPRESDIAAAAADDPTRWGVAHLLVGVGIGLIALAFLAVRSYLREAGEERWSVRALPPVVLASALTAILTGMEFAPLAAAETGGDVEAVQSELMPWFLVVNAASAVTLAIGMVGFALAIARSGVLSSRLTRIVVAGLLAVAVARVVPLGFGFYVVAVAGIVALWPLAYQMWEQPAGQAQGQPRPTPAI